jgi:hypothetical protein
MEGPAALRKGNHQRYMSIGALAAALTVMGCGQPAGPATETPRASASVRKFDSLGKINKSSWK